LAASRHRARVEDALRSRLNTLAAFVTALVIFPSGLYEQVSAFIARAPLTATLGHHAHRNGAVMVAAFIAGIAMAHRGVSRSGLLHFFVAAN
jgi:hypothetical protein